jgi:hypothetical protein
LWGVSNKVILPKKPRGLIVNRQGPGPRLDCQQAGPGAQGSITASASSIVKGSGITFRKTRRLNRRRRGPRAQDSITASVSSTVKRVV